MTTNRIGRVGIAALVAAGTFAVAAPADAGSTVSRCTTGVLALSHTRQDIGAGNGVEFIVFTNKGAKTCELTGFPGVAYVAKSGAQLGAAADREGASHGQILIAPGHKARARFEFINNVGAVPGCYHHRQQAQAVGLRVYPPGSASAMFVRDPHPACRSMSVHLLHIRSVRAS
ncbi:MAG: hypothetical protein QOJ03_2010 [Frankiaceae bacterium]|jgi:hypothetical protein|nr:hypothetical protein [Frankiaceae bacterium]